MTSMTSEVILDILLAYIEAKADVQKLPSTINICTQVDSINNTILHFLDSVYEERENAKRV